MRKIKDLYFEYWKVFAVFVPVCMLAGVSGVSKDLEIFLWNLSGLSISYCGEWWFFTAYIGLLFTFPYIFRHLKKNSDVFTDCAWIVLYSVFERYILPEIYEHSWASRLEWSVFWEIFDLILANGVSFYFGCIFAKYNMLSKLKGYFLRTHSRVLLAVAWILILFYMRHQTGEKYDFLYASIFTPAAIAVFEAIPWKLPYNILCKIGREGTTIWLVHSVYCYLLCQRIVFLPRYNVLIFTWLLIMSYLTSIVLKKAQAYITDRVCPV